MKIKVGANAKIIKKFTQAEVDYFSAITMDTNRIHFDAAFASQTIFKKPIVQGPLVVSLFGGILGSTLPGDGTIYLTQESNFKAPVFIDENITVHLEIIDIRLDKNIIKLRTYVEKENGQIAVDGFAIVKYLNKIE
jgi:3-hydroxybutyryl-CoA dehydratase